MDGKKEDEPSVLMKSSSSHSRAMNDKFTMLVDGTHTCCGTIKFFFLASTKNYDAKALNVSIVLCYYTIKGKSVFSYTL